MSEQFHWDPDSYMDFIRAEIPRFDEIQSEAIAAIEGAPRRVLDLGIGTGETTRRLLERFPGAEVTGLDSSSAMCFRARAMGIDVQLARMEDPLPDGPWDLVISVLAVHHLLADAKRDLFRRVHDQATQLVIGDVFAVPEAERVIELSDLDHPDPIDEVAAWCEGEVVWSADDVGVIRASY